MSGLPAITRILGVDPGASPAEILGLPAGREDPASVDAALRRRLAQVLAHDLRHTTDADEARAVLRRVADQLKQEGVMETAYQEDVAALRPSTGLGQLERGVLAVLVGEGGWNRKSRARLVAVCHAYGIPVEGLIEVLQSLAEQSRSGTGPLAPGQRQEVLSGHIWTQVPTRSTPMSRIDDLIEGAARHLTPDLREPNQDTTIKLAVLFGLLTMIALVLGVRLMFMAPSPGQGPSDAEPLVSSLGGDDADEEPGRPAAAAILQLVEYPTFRADSYPGAAAASADRASEALAGMRDVAADLATGDSGAMRDSREAWLDGIGVAGSSWPYLDAALREGLSAATVAAVRALRPDPDSGVELLATLEPPAADPQVPLSVLHRTWTLEQLALIACDSGQAAEVRDAARDAWSKATAGLDIPCQRGEARRAALDYVAGELAQVTQLAGGARAAWELWLVAAARDPDPTQQDLRRFGAVRRLLERRVDLSRDSETRRVLGRLLEEVLWDRTLAGRDVLLAMHEDASIESSDLWGLGSMLVRLEATSWVLPRHVVAPGATMQQRRLAMRMLARDWPIDWTPPQLASALVLPHEYAPDLAEEWSQRASTALAIADPLERLVVLRRLNEAAAAMWFGDANRTGQILDRLEEDLLPEQPYVEADGGGSARSGYGTVDGAWTRDFRQAASRPQERIELLDELASSDEDDLGPQDADTLARAALVDVTRAVRQAGLDVIINRFPGSANVAAAIVDYLSSARSRNAVTAIVASLTEAALPLVDDPNWDAAARRALVQYALASRGTDHVRMDRAGREAAASCLSEARLVDASLLLPSREPGTTEAMEMLSGAWRRRLERGASSALAEAISANRRRAALQRRDADGVLQEFLLGELDLLELLALTDANWRGQPLGNAMQARFEATVAAGDKDDVIEQITLIEGRLIRRWGAMFAHATEELERRIMEQQQ